MRQFLSRIRRSPAVNLILLPTVMLPLASLLVNAIVMPALRSALPLTPIFDMIATQGLLCLLASGGFYILRGGGNSSVFIEREPVLNERSWDWLWEGLLPCLLILLAVNKFYLTSVSWEVGPHRFFDELGLDAAYAQRIFQGDVFFRDCVMIYNVLMFWPIFVLMKIFGHQLWVLQAWTLVLELACLWGLFAALRFLTEDRWLSLLGLGFCVFLFYPDTPYPHASYSRYHLGLFPGLLAAWAWRREQKSIAWLGGLAAALYFFYTYDYGMVAGLALTLSFILVYPKYLNRLISTTALWLIPVLLFFLWLIMIKGGISPALETLFYFPLHYHPSNVWWPFPELWRDTLDMIARPGGPSARAWILSQLAIAPYLIYAVAFLGLWFGPMSRARPEKKFLACYLLVFAWGCAPKYIFRTGYLLTGTHLYLAPSLLLAFWILADWGKHSGDSPRENFETRILSAWMLIILLGYLRCHWDPALTERLASNPFIPRSAPAPAGYLPLQTPSTRGIYVPAEWKQKLEPLHRQLSASMDNSRDLYVFPYDPIWYFLLERKNASRSDITGDVLPGGWTSVFDPVIQSPPPFILISNFAKKPEPPVETRRPLEELLGTHYGQEPAVGLFRLRRETDDK